MLLLKVCGMKDENNIAELLKIQPDFIGFIFHENSPRNVSTELNIEVPNTILKVGVFVDKSEDFIYSKIHQYQLNSIQLHGFEPPSFCKKMKATGVDVIKAFNIYDGFDFNILKEYEPFCNFFLFDAFGKKAGGNGITFNWKELNNYKGKTPFLLSGGIDNDLVKKIKKITHEQFIGVDINSKFETASGYKNIEKIKQFKNELSSK